MDRMDHLPCFALAERFVSFAHLCLECLEMFKHKGRPIYVYGVSSDFAGCLEGSANQKPRYEAEAPG